MSTYFKNISEGINTTVTGLKLTLRHLWNARNRRKPGDIRSGNFYDQQDGMVTIQYPLETIPIPDNGRYRLHNEMDDCIVCDKCVKVCPVDCIEIEPIRAIEEVGRASDGSPIRLYAAKFDIDMAKCCYCGLCTTVCPTECLTMTKTFDYSELDVRDMVYNYANLSPDEADEKRRLLDQFQKEKEALKAAAKPVTTSQGEAPAAPAAKPVFKPTIKPKAPVTETKEEKVVENKAETEKPASKAPFRPVMKPKPVVDESVEKSVSENPVEPVEVKPPAAKPPFRPLMKPKVVSEEHVEKPVENTATELVPAPVAPKPAFRPTMKPKMASEDKVEEPIEIPAPEPVQEQRAETPAPKPAFRPTMKPKAQAAPETKSEEPPVNPENVEQPETKPKPAFKPTMKPRPKE